MASEGHSIIGDEIYGGQRWKSMIRGEVRTYIMKMNRVALHACTLGFKHPVSSEWMNFESLPQALDENDPLITIEGLPAPKRAIFIAVK